MTARRHRLPGTLAGLMALATLAAACGQNTVVLPSRTFDRPTDMTFACVGVFTPPAGSGLPPFTSGQPVGKCHPSGLPDTKSWPPVTIDGTEYAASYRTYAFVPNTERGDLSVVDMSYCRPDDSTCFPPGAGLVDLDPTSEGYGAAVVGELPEAIVASQDGCAVVTANRGSCDLSFVDPTVLLAAAQPHSPAVSALTRTITPRTSSGRLALAPGEIAFLPQLTANPAAGGAGLCQPSPQPSPTPATLTGTLASPVGGTVASEAAPATWRMVVTFPSCDLLALIDLPSGDLLDSYRLAANVDATEQPTGSYALVHTGRDPVCPVTDCPRATVPVPGDDALSAAPPDDAAVGATPDGSDDGGGTEAGEGDGGDDGAAGDDASDGGSGGTDAGTGEAGAADGGTSNDAGGSVSVPGRVRLGLGALAIHPGGQRIYFGALDAPVVGALDVTGAADTLAVPVAGAITPLHAGASGSVRMRLSIDPYAYAKGQNPNTGAADSVVGVVPDPARPEYGRFVAGRHDDQPSDPLEFLYVIARDGTVRLLNVALVLQPSPFECDLAIDPYDPKALAFDPDESDATRHSCFAYHDPSDPNDVPDPDAPRRRLFAGGPGLRLPSPAADVAFANYRTPRRQPDPNAATVDVTSVALDEQTLTGAFAFVMTSVGNVYIANIDPELRRTAQVLPDPAADNDLTPRAWPESPRPLTGTLRNANVVTFSPALGPQSGPPRLDIPPIAPSDGPSLKSFLTQSSRINALIVPTRPFDKNQLPAALNTYVYFPNRLTPTAQTWNITWEGDLTGVRITGDLRPSPTNPAVMTITDNGTGFCGLGALDGDVMTLVGCDNDSNCSPGTVCVHSTRVPATIDGRPISGLCLPQADAVKLRDGVCASLLETFRRYEVFTSPDRPEAAAVIVPKRAEAARVGKVDQTDGTQVACDLDSSDCEPINGGTSDFKCVTVTARTDGRPLAGDPQMAFELRRRCLQPCGPGIPKACSQGRVCVNYPPDGSFCAEAPPLATTAGQMTAPILDCGLDQLVSYKISAGNAFVVSGSASGRLEQTRTVVDGDKGPVCVTDTSIPVLVARIPLNLPKCTAANNLPVVANGNPKHVGNTTDWDPAYLVEDNPPQPNPCLVIETVDGKPDIHTALFQNSELRFVMTDLQKAIAEGFQLRFDVHGGAAPALVFPSSDALPGLPARIMVGPVPSPDQAALLRANSITIPEADGEPGLFSDLPYLYVVDQRQVTGGRVGVRGQILRIVPRIADTTTPVAGFESFSGSGRYFPIQ